MPTVIGPEHEKVGEPFREHGRHWVVCLDCGAAWSTDEQGEPEEEVAAGDGTCLELALNEEREDA